jgi:uncharacterized membrane-anchored protein YitT (DUF2179 family)
VAVGKAATGRTGKRIIEKVPHTLLDEIQGIVTGALFFSLALHFLLAAGLMTGGTPGIAFLVHYLTGLPIGPVLFALNIPFYVFAWSALGATFTLKTLAAVTLVALFTAWLPSLLTIGAINPVFSAVIGGLCAGVAILMLIRHQASLGGLNVLAVFLQKRFGWSAGIVQGLADALILSCALLAVSPSRVGLSMLAAAALNAVIAINHRQGRYYGT